MHCQQEPRVYSAPLHLREEERAWREREREQQRTTTLTILGQWQDIHTALTLICVTHLNFVAYLPINPLNWSQKSPDHSPFKHPWNVNGAATQRTQRISCQCPDFRQYETPPEVTCPHHNGSKLSLMLIIEHLIYLHFCESLQFKDLCLFCSQAGDKWKVSAFTLKFLFKILKT